MIYVPLGMRCNTAHIIRYKLKLINQTTPFDWCQMTANSMAEWIDKRPDRKFIKKYFSKFTENKNQIGDWFPHEKFWDDQLIDKYLRRSDRFHDILSSEEDKTFIVTHGQPSDISTMYPALLNTCNGNIKFMTFNVGQSLDPQIQVNIDIKLEPSFDNEWILWDNKVISILRSIIPQK